MLRARLLTALVGLPALIYAVGYAPAWAFTAAVVGLTCVGLAEYYTLTRADCCLPRSVGVVWGALVALSMVVGDPRLVAGALAAGCPAVCILSLRDPRPERAVRTAAIFVFGSVYVGVLFPHFVWLHRGPDGAAWVFFVLLVAMLGDTAAYAVGRAWGQRPLLAHVSPAKTVEGSIGATGGHLVAGLIAWQWLLPDRGGLELLSLALVGGVLAQCGDLCESALKRAYRVKDAGRFFPGHGGVLDRIDSLLFPAVFIHYYVAVWN